MNESAGVRLLGPDDAAVLDNLVTDVFDGPVQPALVQEFLNDSRHHLAVAVLDGQVIGMASGVHYLHPDKPNAFWINEIGVAPAHQTQGIGRALMERLLEHAKALGCGEAWLAVDADNAGARQFYAALGGQEKAVISVTFKLEVKSEQ